MNDNNNTDSVLYAVGTRGYSAYEVAVQNGFVGTEEEWLDSLVGPQGVIGPQGKSAYEVGVEEGYEGTEEEWVNSFLSADGYYNKNEIDAKIAGQLKQSDIVDDLVSDSTDKVLSAKQGKVLKNSIDATNANIQDIEGDIETEKDDRETEDANLRSLINSLASGSPLAASSTSEMTDTTKIYVNTSDGKWYYYDGDSWEIGGVYQASIIDGSMIDGDVLNNILNNIVVRNQYIPSNNNIATDANFGYIPMYFPVNEDDVIKINPVNNNWLCIYNENKVIQSRISTASYTVASGIAYVRFNLSLSNLNTVDIKINDVSIFKKYYADWLLIKKSNLINSTVKGRHITDNCIHSNKIFNEQLFITENSVLTQTGTFPNASANSTYSHTELYPVEENDIVSSDYANSRWLVAYDENKDAVQYDNAIVSPYGHKSYVVPNGVKYVALNILNSIKNDFSFSINDEIMELDNKRKLKWLDLDNYNYNRWNNKNMIMFGDSIVLAQRTSDDGYVSRLKNGLDLNIATKMGYSGAKIKDLVNPISQTNFAPYDLAYIAIGTNDLQAGSTEPIGTLGQIGDTTFNTTTFYGAYRACIERILTSNPNIRLVLMTPLQRKDLYNIDVNYVNDLGLKLIDYADMIIKLGEMYSLPVIDLYRKSGVNNLNLNGYTFDGLHPNIAGYDFISGYLVGQSSKL